MDITKSLVREIVEVASAQGINKSGLALQGGITPEQLSRLLGGSHVAKADTLNKLAAAVGLRLALVPDDDFVSDLLSGKLLGGDGP